jgi:hypothetical protein
MRLLGGNGDSAVEHGQHLKTAHRNDAYMFGQLSEAIYLHG